MNVLACVKRVPATGGRIVLTPDGQDIDTKYLGFTVSPHEECAVEEAVRMVEAHGGESTVLTLGPAEARGQIEDALAMGIDRGILLETDGREWDPAATASAIVDRIGVEASEGRAFDVLLFGNEAADSGDYQVGVRVAHTLDLPCVTGIKALEFRDGSAVAKREAFGGWEVYDVDLPAVFTVKEGINLPRFPSVPGRLKAKRKPVERTTPEPREGGLEKIVLKLPDEKVGGVEILGRGPEAVPSVVEMLRRTGILTP
jgi:electron transfer flavoprotein beta subunit